LDQGTVFSISTAGEEKVVYSFAGVSDGKGPEAALLNGRGTLYGATGHGGSSSCSASGYSGVFHLRYRRTEPGKMMA
jgi:hypothetical protein